jgi:hypothetical protein
MSNEIKYQRKEMSKALTERIMEYMSGINGMNEAALQKLVSQSAKKLARRYYSKLKTGKKKQLRNNKRKYTE